MNPPEESSAAPEKVELATVTASWNFSLDQIRAGIEHNDDEAKDALVGAFRWCNDPAHPVKFQEFAAKVGFSPNTLWKIYNGSYTDPTDKTRLLPASQDLIKAINEFLDLEQDRAVAPMDFVLTPTAKKILGACELARESQTPVWIWGPSQIGKTWTLRYAAQKFNHGRTYLCELKAACGLGGMVETIARGCGVRGKSNTKKYLARIERALTPNTLLIIDEVHLLHHTYRQGSFFACLEVIRRLIDQAKCGAVLSWTHLDDVRAANDGELQQIWRRGVHKIPLPMQPTIGDVTAILKHHGLSFPDKKFEVSVRGKSGPVIVETPYDVLRQLGKEQGLKSITERIRYAKKLAHKENARVGWEHFVKAHCIIQKQSVPDDGKEWA